MLEVMAANARLPFVQVDRSAREKLLLASPEAREAAEKHRPSPADEAFVSGKLAQRGVLVLWFKSSCAFCCHARKVLESLVPRPALDIVELDRLGQPRHAPIQQVLRRWSGTSAVPQIYLNGNFFSDGQGVDHMHRQGLLVP